MTATSMKILLLLFSFVLSHGNATGDGVHGLYQGSDTTTSDGSSTSTMTIVGQPAGFGVAWGNDSVHGSIIDNEDEEGYTTTTTTFPPIKARVLYLPSNPLLCDNVEQTKIEEADIIEYVSGLSLSASTTTTFSVNATGSALTSSNPLPIAILAERGNCPFGVKAQTVESIFGLHQGSVTSNVVKYLLIQNYESDGPTSLVYTMPWTGVDSQLLSTAMITYQDGADLKQILSQQGSTSTNTTLTLDDGGATNTITANSIYVMIDATSRAIIEGCGCPLDEAYKLTLLLTRLTGAMSFVGSLYIVVSLTWKRRNRIQNLKSTFNRLLVALSIFDMISSIAFFFANWPVPRSPPNDGEYMGRAYISQNAWDSRYAGVKAAGSAACSTQGFFIHFGVLGSTFATGFIALQTLLMVRYNWTERSMRKAEKVFFGIIAIYPLSTAIAATSMGLMNPLPTAFCWIDVPVNECLLTSHYPLLEDYCNGINTMDETDYLIYKLLLGFAVIFFTFILVLCSMISLYLSVRAQERRAARWSSNAAEGRAQRQVFTKGMSYIGAYLIIWTPAVTAIFVNSLSYEGAQRLNAIVSISLPLQGCFNAVIYSGALNKCGKLCTQISSSLASSATSISSRTNRKSSDNGNVEEKFGSSKNASAKTASTGGLGSGHGPTSNNALVEDRTSSTVRASQASMTEHTADVAEKE